MGRLGVCPCAVRHRAVWLRPGRPASVAAGCRPAADPAPRPAGRHQARPGLTTHVSAHLRHEGALGWDGCAPTSTRLGTHYAQHGFSLRPLRKVRAAPRMGPLLRLMTLQDLRENRAGRGASRIVRESPRLEAVSTAGVGLATAAARHRAGTCRSDRKCGTSGHATAASLLLSPRWRAGGHSHGAPLTGTSQLHGERSFALAPT